MDAVILGDLHLPFVHKKAMTWALNFIKKEQPKLILQIGDAFDFYSFTKFPHSYNLMTPKDEVLLGRQQYEEIWGYVKRVCPKARRIQLRGNHSDRPMKRLMEKAPELEAIFDLKDIWKMDGVEVIGDTNDELILEDTCFMHGYKSKLGDHAAFNRMNTWVGHSHRGGMVFTPSRGEVYWEANAGYLADPMQTPLRYRQQKWCAWTLGLGRQDAYGPRFIPFPG